MTQSERTVAALNRVAKWRSILTGQAVGTRAKGDPVGEAFRDLFEKLILLRVENSAVVGLLLEKRLITGDDWLRALELEAEELTQAYEQRFPGMRATDDGISLDLEQTHQYMKDWPA